MDANEPEPFKIKVDEDKAHGEYVNLCVVQHNPEEFVLDFVFVAPQLETQRIARRIVTSPAHAKRMIVALSENVARYEERFGLIPDHSKHGHKGPLS
jgi:hypothetical protein